MKKSLGFLLFSMTVVFRSVSGQLVDTAYGHLTPGDDEASVWDEPSQVSSKVDETRGVPGWGAYEQAKSGQYQYPAGQQYGQPQGPAQAPSQQPAPVLSDMAWNYQRQPAPAQQPSAAQAYNYAPAQNIPPQIQPAPAQSIQPQQPAQSIQPQQPAQSIQPQQPAQSIQPTEQSAPVPGSQPDQSAAVNQPGLAPVQVNQVPAPSDSVNKPAQAPVVVNIHLPSQKDDDDDEDDEDYDEDEDDEYEADEEYDDEEYEYDEEEDYESSGDEDEDEWEDSSSSREHNEQKVVPKKKMRVYRVRLQKQWNPHMLAVVYSLFITAAFILLIGMCLSYNRDRVSRWILRRKHGYVHVPVKEESKKLLSDTIADL